jgi:alginate O-acetyltransferase complex protein AlgF
MRNSAHHFAGILSLFVCLSGSAFAAEPQLYETGPSEESSYVRFVNATDNAVVVTASKGGAKIELSAGADGRASHFFLVKAGKKLSAAMQSGGRKASVDVTGKPWEYITIVALPGSASQLKTMLVRESPDDFNAMRASLALFNLDATCDAAVMKGGAKNATILDHVKPFSVQRRLVNPIRLAVSVACGAESQGAAADLSQLEAGERYSVFLLTLKNSRQAFFVRDVN